MTNLQPNKKIFNGELFAKEEYEFFEGEWIKKILKSGNLSANKLLALTNGESWFIERKRKTFLQYVKIAKKKWFPELLVT